MGGSSPQDAFDFGRCLIFVIGCFGASKSFEGFPWVVKPVMLRTATSCFSAPQEPREYQTLTMPYLELSSQRSREFCRDLSMAALTLWLPGSWGLPETQTDGGRRVYGSTQLLAEGVVLYLSLTRRQL